MIASLQAGGAIPTTPWQMIANATPFAKGVLLLLAVLSVVSWAIMLLKWREFRRVRESSRWFMREFERLTRFDEALALANRSQPSPFTRIFQRAVRFVPDQRPADPIGGGEATLVMSGSRVEALRFVLDSETADERDQLGRFIPWLATIGSVSPLIGLLGTVVGVIYSFIGIATAGSGNISAVAPGVAEALIATAAALSVAIPAVFGYNFFANRLNRLESELEGFGSEVIALLVREGRI
jgi:biopolymer transport protein TolQ